MTWQPFSVSAGVRVEFLQKRGSAQEQTIVVTSLDTFYALRDGRKLATYTCQEATSPSFKLDCVRERMRLSPIRPELPFSIRHVTRR